MDDIKEQEEVLIYLNDLVKNQDKNKEELRKKDKEESANFHNALINKFGIYKK